MLACYIISGIYNEVFRDSAHLHALSLPNRAIVICPLDLKHLCSNLLADSCSDLSTYWGLYYYHVAPVLVGTSAYDKPILVRTAGLEPARAYAHQTLILACLPISTHPHMYRWVIKDSNLSLFIQLSEETHPSYTGSDTHSGCFRSFYSHSSLYYLSAPCGSTHMYSRLVICLAGLRHPIRLVAQDIAFMVGDEGIAPTRTRRFWFYRPAPLL